MRRLLAAVGGLVLLCAACSSGSSGSSVSSVSSDPPVERSSTLPAVLIAVPLPGDSKAFAASEVPSGLVLAGVLDDSSATSPGGIEGRVPVRRTILYGDPTTHAIVLTIDSFDGISLIMPGHPNTRTVVVHDRPATLTVLGSTEAELWWSEDDGRYLVVHSFDPTLDVAAIAGSTFEISTASFDEIRVATGDGLQVGSVRAPLDGEWWEMTARVPWFDPQYRGPGRAPICAVLEYGGERTSVCTPDNLPIATVREVRLDGRRFVLGVVASAESSFTIRSRGDDAYDVPVTAVSGDSPTYRPVTWIVAPLPEPVGDCLYVRSESDVRFSIVDPGAGSNGVDDACGPLVDGTPSPTSTVWWMDARAIDDSRLEVSFTGGPPVTDTGDRCQVDYVAVVDDGPVVTITVRPLVVDRPRTTEGAVFGCTSIGYGRTVMARLPVPLAGRSVADGANGTVHEVIVGPRNSSVGSGGG